jgi:hypothetical protein
MRPWMKLGEREWWIDYCWYNLHYVIEVNSPFASSILESPGSTILNVPRWLRARLSWLSISSCSLGTSASFARLPKRDVDFKSNVKSGSMVTVNAGTGDESGGGMITTYKG